MLQSQSQPHNTVGSYWETTVAPTKPDRQLIGSAVFDMAVVGAGFAGLSAALKLAQSGVSVCVLEKEHVGFGASGRSGGMCCLSGIWPDTRALVRAVGLEEARKFLAYQVAGINLVASRVSEWGVDTDSRAQGHMHIATSANDFRLFASEVDHLKDKFGVKARLLTSEEARSAYYGNADYFGGVHLPYGFNINPLVYLFTLAHQLRQAGGRIFGKSAVTGIEKSGERWQLATEHGAIRARKILLTCSGQLGQIKPKWLRAPRLNVVSSVQVTRPLTNIELAEQGWRGAGTSASTKKNKTYMRLLPDNRFLFGAQLGVSEDPKAVRQLHKHTSALFRKKFPAWSQVEMDFAWHESIRLCKSKSPFVGELPELSGVYAATGWQGHALAMASISGDKIASLMTGKAHAEDLPISIAKPLKPYTFPRIKRLLIQIGNLRHS